LFVPTEANAQDDVSSFITDELHEVRRTQGVVNACWAFVIGDVIHTDPQREAASAKAFGADSYLMSADVVEYRQVGFDQELVPAGDSDLSPGIALRTKEARRKTRSGCAQRYQLL
jgi:hypothetical protein